MRHPALLAIVLWCLPALAWAQRPGDRVTTEHKDVGRLSVRVQTYN
jgi:hypothetical protein